MKVSSSRCSFSQAWPICSPKRSAETCSSTSLLSTRLSASQLVSASTDWPASRGRISRSTRRSSVSSKVVAEHRQLAVQLELRAEQAVALKDVGRRQRGGAQAVDALFGGHARGAFDAFQGGFEGRRQTWCVGRVHRDGSVCSLHRRSDAGTGAVRPGRADYFFNASRISRSSTTSSGVAAALGGCSARLSRLICRTMMKMMKARMMKFSATVRKLP